MPSAVPSTIQAPLVGLALPLTTVGGGWFRTKDRYDMCWGALLLALFCPIGAAPMRRTLGSPVSTLVFDPRTPLLAKRLTGYIQDTANRWCPQVRVLDVRVVINPENVRTVSVAVTFAPAAEALPQSRLILLDRTGPVLRYLSSAQQGAA